MKLKPTDKKLLAYLYHNNRETLTKIAKGSGLSREQVDYKINKLIQIGIIKKFIPIINYSKLGYTKLIVILLKFNKQENINIFMKEHLKDSFWISRGEILAKYDLFMTLIFRNDKEKNDYLTNLLQKHNKYILDYLILQPYFAELYPIKFLGNKKREDYILAEYQKKNEILDEKDKAILKVLEKNARTKFIDIAKKTGLSSELILYKLKKLNEKGVLLGSRIQFDTEKLGYFYATLLINIKEFSSENQAKIRDFARDSPHIITTAFMLGKPNCFISLLYKSENDLRNLIENMRNLFKNQYIEIEILPVKSEKEEINTLPFLS